MERRIPQDIGDYAFDLIVVGAGINGAGIARDAAMRGLKVLLDKEDFGSGTTSWSGRLIHGGLRYLEYYEFSLVRESLSDREKLLKMAPHLVRPLPYVPEGVEAGITRRHIIHDHAKDEPGVGGLISIVGGKLTTYRNLSRQTVDKVYKKLGKKAPPCRTAEAPLPGGQTRDFEGFATDFRETSSLTASLANRLLRLYGVRAPEVVALAGTDGSLLTPLSHSDPSGVVGAEILYAFERELAQTLTDALQRRTMAGMGPTVGLDLDEAATDVAVRHLGWDRERAEHEVHEHRRYVERFRPRVLAAHGRPNW